MSAGVSLSGFISESDVLSGIWVTSGLLALTSLVILCVLAIRREMFAKREIVAQARRVVLTEYFHAALRSPIALDHSALPSLVPGDAPLIIHIAVDMIRAIQGQDAKRIVDLVRLWDLFPQLRSLLSHGRRGTRIQALTLLAYFNDEESLALLFVHARETDPYVQLAALRGLATRNTDKRTFTAITDLSVSNQSNALMLADILRRFGEPSLPALHDLASGNANSRIKTAAIIAIGNIGALTSFDTLRHLLEDSTTEIRANAAAALGNIGDERAAPAIAAMLDDPQADVRVQAAKALGMLKAENTLPYLSRGLGDVDWWVRFGSAKSICNFGDKGIALLRAASNQHSLAGVIATQVLAEMVDI